MTHSVEREAKTQINSECIVTYEKNSINVLLQGI